MNTRNLEVRFEDSPKIDIPMGVPRTEPTPAAQPRSWWSRAFQNKP